MGEFDDAMRVRREQQAAEQREAQRQNERDERADERAVERAEVMIREFLAAVRPDDYVSPVRRFHREKKRTRPPKNHGNRQQNRRWRRDWVEVIDEVYKGWALGGTRGDAGDAKGVGGSSPVGWVYLTIDGVWLAQDGSPASVRYRDIDGDVYVQVNEHVDRDRVRNLANGFPLKAELLRVMHLIEGWRNRPEWRDMWH